LGEFLSAVYEIMKKMKERGAVGIKNQSAYVRSIRYDLVSKSDAESLFNKILDDPNSNLGWPGAKPLDDFLFHEYMRFANKLSLPVQIHTGYLAGKGNRVDRANASQLANVIELHKNVTFDLFHGNWPYMGDLLFLAKNYKNVFMNLCWVHGMDPYYSIELMMRAIYSVPHAKILGFGADYHFPEHVETHLSLARQNISEALSRLADKGWLTQMEAVEIAQDWLYNTPNEVFKLGLPEIR
jgi:predicted TIM-barrel fold metal-dependent hydrolase